MFQVAVEKLGFKGVPAKSYLWFFLGLISFSALFISFKNNYVIDINLTESLPQKVFLVEKNAGFKRGDLVKFGFETTDERFYENGTEMIKYLMGVPGDEVVFKGLDFYINGEYIGTAKSNAKTGEKLVLNQSKVLGEDEYFVFSPHKDSFDSRYAMMGYIHKHQIQGRVVYAK